MRVVISDLEAGMRVVISDLEAGEGAAAGVPVALTGERVVGGTGSSTSISSSSFILTFFISRSSAAESQELARRRLRSGFAGLLTARPRDFSLGAASTINAPDSIVGTDFIAGNTLARNI